MGRRFGSELLVGDSLVENFDGLWESVELFRGMSQRPGATAATH